MDENQLRIAAARQRELAHASMRAAGGAPRWQVALGAGFAAATVTAWAGWWVALAAGAIAAAETWRARPCDFTPAGTTPPTSARASVRRSARAADRPA